MSNAILPHLTPGQRAMSKDPSFPDVPPVSRDLQLSLVAAQVSELLAEADALYGVFGRNTRSEADVLIGMREPKRLEKAEQAASTAAMQVVRGAIHHVASDWEDHTHGYFLEQRLSEVHDMCQKAGEAAMLAYWTAIREPHRFCACGNSYRNEAEMTRAKCGACEVGGVQ